MTAFRPSGSTVTLSATTTTSGAAIGGASPSKTIRLVSPPTNTALVFVEFGGPSVTSTTAKMPILPGSIEIFLVSDDLTHIAGITASGSATIYVTPGEGV